MDSGDVETLKDFFAPDAVWRVGGSGGQSMEQHGVIVFTLSDGKVTEVNEFQEDTARASDFWA